MIISPSQRCSLAQLGMALILVCAAAFAPHSAAMASPANAPDAVPPSAEAPADDLKHEEETPERRRHAERHSHQDGMDHHDGNLVSLGHDSTLGKGEQAESVVSIFGSSTNDGHADDVVSILGNTRVTGSVADSAVAVVGNAFVDGKVDGDVVAVIVNVELGPHAEIGGDVVSVLGGVHRDPAAVVHGGVQSILSGDFGDFGWLQAWIRHCLVYARPLSLASGLGWAWRLALGFLAFYALLALLCRPAISRCVQTFQDSPGRTLLAAMVGILLTPLTIALLFVTVIGIAAVPFVITAIWCSVFFGKAVMLAWLGGRVTGNTATGALGHPAVAVLIGGAIVLALYLVPVVGFLVFNLLGILGFGVVLYTLILAVRSRQAAKVGVTPAGGGSTASIHTEPQSQSQSQAQPEPQPQAAQDHATAPPPPGGTGSGPPPVTASLPRAGFWIRMAALLLDVILVGFAMSVFRHGSHLHLVALATYGAVMWKLRGSTVGGIVFHLQVVRIDGREVDWETAIVRALGCFLSLAVAGIGFLWIAFDDAGQAWHDKIAGTVVVRVPKNLPLV